MKNIIIAMAMIISFNVHSNEPYKIGTSNMVHLTGYNIETPREDYSMDEYLKVKGIAEKIGKKLYTKDFGKFTATKFYYESNTSILDTFSYVHIYKKNIHAFMYTTSKEGSIPLIFTESYGIPHKAVEKGSLKEYIWFFRF